MAFPAGPLPTPSDTNAFAYVTAPIKSVAYAGSAALDLTDPANGLTPCSTEFYCTTAGNLVARLAGDSANRTYPVTVGQVLKGLFVLVDATSTAVGIFRQ
jgi:hypothetical protein